MGNCALEAELTSRRGRIQPPQVVETATKPLSPPVPMHSLGGCTINIALSIQHLHSMPRRACVGGGHIVFPSGLPCLARSANLPEGLCILFLSNDRSYPNYLTIRWTDFRDLCIIIDLDLFFHLLKGRCQNFGQNWQNELHSAGWRSETGRNMEVPIQKFSMAIL